MDAQGMLESRLLSSYRGEFAGPPEWAYPLAPSIPFVGRDYQGSTPRVLLYATAENLAAYQRKPDSIPEFLRDDRVFQRHRAAFDEGEKTPFPRLHIKPVENGSLLCAMLFMLMQRFGATPPEHPWQLAERLAIANFSKFSIATEDARNRDHASRLTFLRSSLPYVVTDLEVLRPDVLVLPRVMHGHVEVRSLIARTLPAATVVPVPQFNTTVVNIHLGHLASRGAELERDYAGTALAEWTALLTGYRAGHVYRYYAALDEAFRRHPG